MELSQDEVFIFVGRQALEIAQLRTHVARLSAHRCAPCERQHVDDPLAGEEYPDE